MDRKEYMKKYYEQNKEKILKKNREWSKNNREKRKVYSKEYRKRYFEKIKEYNKKWQENNREKINKKARINRMKKRMEILQTRINKLEKELKES